MGCLESPVQAIANVRFNAMKTADGVSDVTRITKSGAWVIYALTKRGAVYTNGSMGRSIHLTGSTGDEAAALLGLGLITKAELRAHKQWVLALKAWRNANDDVRRFEERCGRLGITLTADQKAKAEAAREEAEQALKDARIAAQRLNADRSAREAKAAPKP